MSSLKKKSNKKPESEEKKVSEVSKSDVVQKKIRKVKFDVSSTKSKDAEAPKKSKEPSVICEVEAAETDSSTKDKKRKRKRNKNGSRGKEKRQKLMEGVLGPKVDTVEFEDGHKKFSDFDLDERILKSIGELGWVRPTQVQESMLSLVLEDKNIMARARTGSGKTAAFLLPLLHKVIALANADSGSGPYAIFIAPTKELASQIYKLLAKLAAPLPFIQTLNLAELAAEESSVWENDTSAMVVSTPGKLLEMLKMRPKYCKKIGHIVLDEADLLLSYGYEQEMTSIKEYLPGQYQCILTSATLTDDMTLLKKVFMTGPVVTIKLKEGDLPDADQLSQYQITCQDENEKYAILVAMFKLRLIIGKSIIFVKDTDKCYQLQLVLRAFAIKSCVLNAAMPANSRCHVIDQFNGGLFNVIIASDATDIVGSVDSSGTVPETENATSSKPKGSKKKVDKESGVSRGIDFHHVANVVNFDFPTTTDSYIHRVGRTARGWNKGTALSFCIPDERPYLDMIQEEINKQMGRKVLMPYEIRIKELDSFVLRTRDVLLKCGKYVIKEARMKEFKRELLRSSKLAGYFTKNPREKELMQIDNNPVAINMNNPAMADVPDYIVPKALQGTDFSVGGKRKGKAGQRQRNRIKLKSHNQKKHAKEQKDPLKSFSV